MPDVNISREIIDRVGGATALASALGLGGRSAISRICNWRRRGIPSAVWLKHAAFFEAMRRKVERNN